MGHGVEEMRAASDPHARRRTFWALLLAACAALVVGTLLASSAASGQEPRDSRVVNGQTVKPGQYRFMASLQFVQPGLTPRQGHFCGGTLIDRDSVLTAAHCVEFLGNGQGQIPVSQVRVAVGDVRLNGGNPQRRAISRIDIDPRYGTGGSPSAYDAAVIRLSRPVSGIPVMRLAGTGTNSLDRAGRKATVTGWGSTELSTVIPVPNEDIYIPNRMQKATVRVVSDAECSRAYPPNGRFAPPFVAQVMVCSSRPAVDTCYGDSGGPMFVDTPRGYRQIGITSYGAGCASAGFPGVYTEVNAPPIISFIQRAAASGL